MSLLRVVQPNEDRRIAVRETYDPFEASMGPPPKISSQKLIQLLSNAQTNDVLKKTLSTGLGTHKAF